MAAAAATDLASVDVFVHLDLKGCPPSVDFLLQLFPLLRLWGATGVVLEYEDMFPWEGPLTVLRHPQAFSPGEVRRQNFSRRSLVSVDGAPAGRRAVRRARSSATVRVHGSDMLARRAPCEAPLRK